MDCATFSALLDNYSNLTKEETAMLEEHSAVCESCKKELEFLKSIINVTSSLPQVEPPADLLVKINAELDRSKPVLSLNKICYNIKAHIKQYSTVAACILVGLIVGLNNSNIKDMLHNEPAHNGGGGNEPVRETSMPVNLNTPLFSNDEWGEHADNATEDLQANPSSEPSYTDENIVPSASSAFAPTIQPYIQASEDKNSNVIRNKNPEPSVRNLPAATHTSPDSRKEKTSEETVKPESVQPTVNSTYMPPAATAKPENEKQKNSENDTEKYTIAQNKYSISENEYAYSEPSPMPTDEIEVEDYELSGETMNVALADTKEGIYDKLHILQGDTDTVLNILNNYNVSYIGPYYRTSLVEFQEILNGLDNAGIYYSYACMRGEEAVVLFTISK